eukprot:Unigene11070_Nuclearia_a/m.33855 Unigene11070_Nuclearia_a/g.33855  ORF Unigene11070_Nuclearia_a/g.33855 Unigene11070_Nuclearia_a/m.33855 type:complete len:142 (-) Unigene11070_Nuclearia_a:85-510(-)
MSSTEWLSDMQKIGIGLTAFGCLFTVVGVLLFFDGGLLAMGNVMFLAGVTLVIGVGKAYNFFFQARKWKGTATFLGGIVLVFLRWPKLGMAVELFGFVNLFGDFFPVVLRFVRPLPLVRDVLGLPFIKRYVDDFIGAKLPV